MKVVLRKNDSTTSVLLFIYNTYSALTNRHTLKLSSLLEIMKTFGKSETSVRMALSRASKANIIKSKRVGNEVSYSLTDAGESAIRVWNEGAGRFWNRYLLRSEKWDGKWYFLSIDFRDDARKVKSKVSEELQQLGFISLSVNTWINPYHIFESVSAIVATYGLEGGIIEVHGEMKVQDTVQFAHEKFGIEKLRQGYTGFLNAYRDALKGGEILSNPEVALPLLHEIGWNFFSVASEDSALPMELLGTWEGDEAVSIMKELRGILLQTTNDHLAKFD